MIYQRPPKPTPKTKKKHKQTENKPPKKAIFDIAPRAGSPEWLAAEVAAARRGLLALRQEVCLLADGEDPDAFYPRWGDSLGAFWGGLFGETFWGEERVWRPSAPACRPRRLSVQMGRFFLAFFPKKGGGLGLDRAHPPLPQTQSIDINQPPPQTIRI
jgi:hypothetical protein